MLLRTILAPYEGAGGGDDRLRINGDDVTLPGNATTTIALILHELATNAAKYGALSSPSGTVTVECVTKKDTLALIWDERGGPRSDAPGEEGFGSLLGRLTSGQLGGTIERDWRPEGLRVTLTVLRDRLS